MLERAKWWGRGFTITQEIAALQDTSSSQNRFYEALARKKKQLKRFLKSHHTEGVPSKELIEYYLQALLPAYQYAMLSYPQMGLPGATSNPEEIAEALEVLLTQEGSARLMYHCIAERYLSTSKPVRYAPLLGILTGTAHQLDIGSGMIPSTFYLHDRELAGQDCSSLLQAHGLARDVDRDLALGRTVALDVQEPDENWGLACSSLLLSHHYDARLTAAIEQKRTNRACEVHTANIFAMSDAQFDSQYRGQFNVVTTMFVMKQMEEQYSVKDWSRRIAQILPHNGIWIYGGLETAFEVGDSPVFGVHMMRRNRIGKMVPVLSKEPIYGYAQDTSSVWAVLPDGRQLFQHPYQLPELDQD